MVRERFRGNALVIRFLSYQNHLKQVYHDDIHFHSLYWLWFRNSSLWQHLMLLSYCKIHLFTCSHFEFQLFLKYRNMQVHVNRVLRWQYSLRPTVIILVKFLQAWIRKSKKNLWGCMNLIELCHPNSYSWWKVQISLKTVQENDHALLLSLRWEQHNNKGVSIYQK